MVHGNKKATREQVIIALAKFIKEESKQLKGDTFSIEVPIKHENWHAGSWNGEWVESDICFDGAKYSFTDKEITNEDFVTIVSTALKESNCNGKIKVNEWDEWKSCGWRDYEIHHKKFECLTLVGKPCKEFNTLNRMLKKYANKELGELEIYTASVCGKRNDWSASDYSYLEHQPKRCQQAIEFIREHKNSKDVLSFEVVEHLDKGEDYEYARRLETEWYGSVRKYGQVTIKTPKGKEKASFAISAH